MSAHIAPAAATAASGPTNEFNQMSIVLANPNMTLSAALDRIQQLWTQQVMSSPFMLEILCLAAIEKAKSLRIIAFTDLVRILELFLRANQINFLRIHTKNICLIFTQPLPQKLLSTYFFSDPSQVVQADAKEWYNSVRTRCTLSTSLVTSEPNNVALREWQSYYMLSEFAKGFRVCQQPQIEQLLTDLQKLMCARETSATIHQMMLTVALAVTDHFSQVGNPQESALLREGWYKDFSVRFQIQPEWIPSAIQVCIGLLTSLGTSQKKFSEQWLQLQTTIKTLKPQNPDVSPFKHVQDMRVRSFSMRRAHLAAFNAQSQHLLRSIDIFSELLLCRQETTPSSIPRMKRGLCILTANSWQNSEVGRRLVQKAFPKTAQRQDVQDNHFEDLFLTLVKNAYIPVHELLTNISWIFDSYRFSKPFTTQILIHLLQTAAFEAPLPYACFQNFLRLFLRDDIDYDKETLQKECHRKFQRILVKGFELDDALHHQLLMHMSGMSEKLAKDLAGKLTAWSKEKAITHGCVIANRTRGLNDLFVKVITRFKLNPLLIVPRLPLHWLRVCVDDLLRIKSFAATFDTAAAAAAPPPVFDIDLPHHPRFHHIAVKHAPPLRYKVLCQKKRLPFAQIKSELLCIIANSYALLNGKLREKADKKLIKLVGLRLDSERQELMVVQLNSIFFIEPSPAKVVTVSVL